MISSLIYFHLGPTADVRALFINMLEYKAVPADQMNVYHGIYLTDVSLHSVLDAVVVPSYLCQW